MTHPEELLAGYVDGTLSNQDRAVVDAHLTACQRCRHEVADSRVAVAALARLPVAPAPAGLGTRAMGEAGPARAGVHPVSSAPRWQRWVVPATAAAALLLVATLVLPKIGGGGTASGDRESASAPGIETALGASVPLEISSTDYRPDGLTSLATESAAKLTTDGGAGAQVASTGAQPPRTAAPAAAANATACIVRAFQQVPGTQVRLIQARFQGQPAYIGLYAEGPGGGQPPDALTVRVASVDGCVPLSIAQVPA